MGDWPIGRGGNTFATTGVTTSGASRGTAVSAPATANTKGSWASLGTCPFHARGFWLDYYNAAGSGVYVLMDLGVGASGAQVVLVPNLAFTRHSQVSAVTAYIPLKVARGEELWARIQSSAVTAQTVRASVVWDAWHPTLDAGLGQCEAYNVNTATSRDTTTVDPGGTANTKGAWTQLGVASWDTRQIMVTIGGSGDTARAAACDMLLDLGVSDDGSTWTTLIANRFLYVGTSEDAPQPYVLGPHPVNIPAGKRLGARAQCSIATAGDRLIGVCAYGFR